MPWEEWLYLGAAIATILGSVFPLIKTLIFNTYWKRTSRSKAEYEQTKDLIKEIEETEKCNKKLHPYLLEKSYAAISGKDNFNADEIVFCLKNRNPSEMIFHYLLGKKFLQYSYLEEKMFFRDKYDTNAKRKKKDWKYKALYVFWSVLFIISIFSLQEIITKKGLGFIILCCMAIVVFLLNAVINAVESGRLKSAEKVINTQKL